MANNCPRADAEHDLDPLHPRGHVIGYCAALALTAGFVNAVAILVLAVPIGNLTGVTTQLGMDTAHPWRYESHVLAMILVGFLVGAAAAGRLLASTRIPERSRHATVLVVEAALFLIAAVGVEIGAVKAQITGLGIEATAVQALLGAAALGLQNGLTSSYQGMAVRTTHFTGTVTDLGLILGRSHRHGIDKWKVALLTVTLVLFLAGAMAGIVAGARLGGYALLFPALICMAVACVKVLHSRNHDNQLDLATAEAMAA